MTNDSITPYRDFSNHPDVLSGTCSRCHKHIEDYQPPDGGMTAGYYYGWVKFMNEGEAILCDNCMWHEPRYIEIYGIVEQEEL